MGSGLADFSHRRLDRYRAAGGGVGVPRLPHAQLIASEFQEVRLGRFTWFSFLFSSVIFGVLHGRWLAGTLAGMLFALALYRRGKLGDAVVAHATTNALLAAYVLATGRWALWV